MLLKVAFCDCVTTTCNDKLKDRQKLVALGFKAHKTSAFNNLAILATTFGGPNIKLEYKHHALK